MINSIASKLQYRHVRQYKSYNSYRKFLCVDAEHSCAYCTITESESPGATFNIDHFRPKELFPDLVATYENLRYSCPRCNSYKSDAWISINDGCKRDCNTCTQHVCHDNIKRFVDSMREDPSECLYLGEDYLLYPQDGNRPASYTIQRLRLNRAQLIKLRHVRKFLDMWMNELEQKRQSAEENISNIRKQREEAWLSFSGAKPAKNIEVVEVLFDMIETIAIDAFDGIMAEISKVEFFTSQRAGSDCVLY